MVPADFRHRGYPLLALLIAVIVGMITLGRGAGITRKHLTMAIESGLPPIARIILIVAAGGGFKQVLVDSGIGTLLARWAEGAHFPLLFPPPSPPYIGLQATPPVSPPLPSSPSCL